MFGFVNHWLARKNNVDNLPAVPQMARKMDKEEREERIVGIRLDANTYKRFHDLATGDDRKVASFIKLFLLKNLPLLEADARTKGITLNEPPAKYAVPGRSRLPKGKRGISKKSEN